MIQLVDVDRIHGIMKPSVCLLELCPLGLAGSDYDKRLLVQWAGEHVVPTRIVVVGPLLRGSSLDSIVMENYQPRYLNR